MKPDDQPSSASAGKPEAPPPASLTDVRMGRSRAQGEPAVKRGDLTQRLAAPPPPEPPPPEPPRAPGKRGDLTQQLEAAARRASQAATPTPAVRPAIPPIDTPFERKPAAAKAEPAPAPKAAPSIPAAEPLLERKPSAKRETPPPKAEAAERKPAAPKAEPAPLPETAIEPPVEPQDAAPEPEPASAPVAAAAAQEPEPLSKPAAAPLEFAPESDGVAAAAEPDVPAPAEDAIDPHADVAAGSALNEDDIRALLDPPGRRPFAPEPAPEAELKENDAEPEPEPRLAEDAPPAAPAPPAVGSSIDEIIDYWDSLRGDLAYPPLSSLDRSHVGRSWPNCLLVAFTAADASTPRLTRLGETNGQVEYTAMVIDWILTRGRHSARRGEPMEEEKRFPISGGNARYQLLMLPLASAPEGNSDYVLCHLCRVQELSAGAAFRRWLAS